MSDIENAVRVEGLHKSFRLPHEQASGIKQKIINFAKRKKGYETQQVLKDVSFEIKKGEFFGIVGRNGSGKSTLLKLLAGIYIPDKGLVQVNGTLTPFIELGVGFNPELTGRENVFLNGALLGFSQSEMEAMYNDIVDFAELTKFMDQKLKNYSSGMQVRLAFSIAIRAKGDILLLDEVLAVGDTIFQKKCYDYFKQLKKDKKTVILVSHDTGVLQEYCTSGILLEAGKIVKEGHIKDIVGEYTTILNEVEQGQQNTSSTHRWGSGEITVEDIRFETKPGVGTPIYTEDQDIIIRVSHVSHVSAEEPVFGITIADVSGLIVFQSNTLWCDVNVRDVEEGTGVEVTYTIPNTLNTGTYSVSPAVSDYTGTKVLDWRDDLARFKVVKKQKSHGIINVEHSLHVDYK